VVPVDNSISYIWLGVSFGISALLVYFYASPKFGLKAHNTVVLAFGILLMAAIFTRFYMLEPRVMSHDESLHTYYSWRLYQGEGYIHDPMMHGPLQFHLVSWSYFLLGDSDFSSRVPAVLFGIASLLMLWGFRRYLGKLGVVAAGVLFVISPYMLYYARYVRNESFVVFFGLVGLWAILRYLETGKNRYLLALTASTSLHFATKETAFIYTAQMLIFLGLLFLNRITSRAWENKLYRTLFLITLLIAVLMLGMAVGVVMFGGGSMAAGEPTLVQPAVPGQTGGASPAINFPMILTLVPAVLGIVALGLAVLLLVRGVGTQYLRQERSLGLLILLGTLVLPQLSPLPVRFMGWAIPDTPGAVQSMTSLDVLHFMVFLIPMAVIAVLIGLWWNSKVWLINAALFYGLFVYLYTTGFSNPSGVISGLVGSLGYWMAQQGVQRGSQPWYYYLIVQIPIYEYLAFGLSILGVGFFIRRQLSVTAPEAEPVALAIDEPDAAAQVEDTTAAESEQQVEDSCTLALYLLIFWFVSSLLAYTAAGEKMPWLTVHIVLPMVLLGGWGFASLVESIRWENFKARRGWLVLLALLVLLISGLGLIGALLGAHPPFRSRQLLDLQATTRFISTLLVFGLAAWALIRLRWSAGQTFRLGVLLLIGIGAVLTARTAFQASYVNYDEANEYLVYAHSARGVKDVMSRIEDLSRRTTDGLALEFGYDDDTSWPMTWYTRNYFNHRYYGNQPGKDLRSLPAIIVGDNNFGAIEPVVGEAYYKFEYIRMVWPNQDYFGLTLDRIRDALTNPEIRAGLFQIWLNRDFTQYGEAIGNPITLTEWSPADRMRLYIRKDVAATLWDYATGPVPEEVVADPYEGGAVVRVADQSIGTAGSGAGQFAAPHGVAVAPDGSLYVADTENNRIQHFSPDGEFLAGWGSFADATVGSAPGGTFNLPWGVAVAPDGSVYAADTWNHRIQKFSPDGEFQTMWGYFGQAEAPEAFWGPRDVAVDAQGHVYVTDTGNKRVVVFDGDGGFITQFGASGLLPGQFDEPVGIDVDANGLVYVADTWNQRVQVFREVNGEFIVERTWAVAAWYGESLENKPYLTVRPDGHVFVTDPETGRVIEFDPQGEFVAYFGGLSSGLDGFGLAAGIASNADGGLWVSDPGNQRVLHFPAP
ncbi:MAG: flippase activity-associated protein Agl23, partial [Anaerolineales bacterium]